MATHRIPIIGILMAAVLITIAYSNISGHKFLNWDDVEYVLKNNRIKSFSLDNLLWMFGDFSMANWHPLTWLTYTFNYAIWGGNPIPFKITNIILHTLNSILVYFLTFKILTNVKNNFHATTNSLFSFALLDNKDLQYAAVLAAILFGIHPLHVESVTWISERKDVLYSFFLLLTILFYINHREKSDCRKWLIASIVMFLLSLMSKPMSVTTPLILLLIDIYPLNVLANQSSLGKKIKILLPNKTTYILLSTLVSIITILTQRAGIQGSEQLTIDSRFINACMSILQYTYHYFWPFNLSTFYSFHPWSTDPNIYSLFPVAIVFCLTLWFIYLAVAKKILFPIIGWLYFIISLLPVIGIVKVGAQAAADRYTYMPLLSFIVINASAIVMLYRINQDHKLFEIFVISTVAGLFSILTYITYQQNNYWKDDESLWTRAIAYSPGTAATPYNNLGAMYFRRGESRSAILEFNKALAIEPNNLTTMEQIGKAYQIMREDAFAIDAYKQLITIYPEHPIGYIRLGDFFYSKHQVDKAKELYTKAFIIMPSLPSTLQRSALVDYLEYNYEASERKLNYVLKLSPDNIGSLQLLAKVKFGLKQYDEANKIANKLLEINPKDTLAFELLQQTNSLVN